MDRRTFLRSFAGATAVAAVAPATLARLTESAVAAVKVPKPDVASLLPFVDHYATNTTSHLTASTNAAVEILQGMGKLWKTGSAWDKGMPLRPDVLRANMLHSVHVTTHRTETQAREAFIHDRQDQSYGVIAGLGPLADPYRTGAKAVTSITSAPDGTPATTIDEGVPTGAPVGSATGAGSADSELGLVVQLVKALRGPNASGNPSKLAYQYPRPWRMTDDSRVVDTGEVDEFGYPVYRSNVVVAPQLLLQRSMDAPNDGGFPSGHTNAFYLAGLALAYAVPERFQEMIAHISYLSDTRIVAGMHSAVDVIGGRILGTALAAAALADPRNHSLKAAAQAQAAEYFQKATGSTADTLSAFAHTAGPAEDPYADRDVNERAVTPRLTYILPRSGTHTPMVVPKAAEVLLETRQPYLSASQRREVLRTTSLPSGYAELDGPEQWGRLDLFAAADGYGAFDTDVSVTMDARRGGYNAADSWRNNIGGKGSLTKRGTGVLTLTGTNSYTGGTLLEGGDLIAAGPRALGGGAVHVIGGSLRVPGTVEVPEYSHRTAQLDVAFGKERHTAVVNVRGTAEIGPRSTLLIRLPQRGVAVGEVLPAIRAHRLHGRFDSVTVANRGLRAIPVYSPSGLSVRVVRA